MKNGQVRCTAKQPGLLTAATVDMAYYANVLADWTNKRLKATAEPKALELWGKIITDKMIDTDAVSTATLNQEYLQQCDCAADEMIAALSDDELDFLA